MNFVSAYSKKIMCFKPFFYSSMTKQSFKKECDINNIMASYKRTAGKQFLDTFSGYMDGIFGDASSAVDYHTALGLINEANVAFDSMPSHVRDRFANDPARLMVFLSDVKNKDEAIKLGLLDSSKFKDEAVEKTA